MSFQEHFSRVGCIRFELVKSLDLLDWKGACRFAGIGREDRKRLQRIGQKLGANPAHWFASPLAVSLGDLRLHVLLENKWGYAEDMAGMAKVWEDHVARHTVRS